MSFYKLAAKVQKNVIGCAMEVTGCCPWGRWMHHACICSRVFIIYVHLQPQTNNRETMSICKIFNTSNNPLPAYESALAAGLDLRANLTESIVLNPGERKLVPTGLFIELPEDCEAQIRPRSGLAFKHGITVLNSPGTIDPDYRGEVKVLLINLSDEPFEIQHGERIAQMVISRFQQVSLQAVASMDELSSTERGAGGFGHSGRK